MTFETPVPTVSVIVPAWREHAAFLELVRKIGTWPEVREVIVSVAEETPDLRTAIEAAGALFLAAGRPNRGRQLNLGARHASGEWLLFNHADTQLTRAHLQALATLDVAHSEAGCAPIVGGAFYRKFDQRHPHCRWIEPIERWHNRTFGALYGDQSLFVRRRHFQEKLGGFADIALMEDVEFSKRLRRSGPLALLDPPIATSLRKHVHRGAWTATLLNAAFILLYQLGVSPERLHAWYYGIKIQASNATPILPQTYEN